MLTKMHTNTKSLTKPSHSMPTTAPLPLPLLESANTFLDRTWIVDTKAFNLTKLGWTLKLNQAKSSLGICQLKLKTICISNYLYQSNSELDDVWTDTIKHEIAHAIDFEIRGKSDHGFHWKHVAKQVGCIPRSSHTGNPLEELNPKYTLHCDTCSAKVYKYKKPAKNCACKKCCKKYNKGKHHAKYALKVIQNY